LNLMSYLLENRTFQIKLFDWNSYFYFITKNW
jgi:hypothetical protein